MSLESKVVEQFHHPRGLLGRLVGAVMAHRSSNLARNRWSVDLLEIRSGDRVLELGPGPGVTLDLLLERAGPTGHVTAVDHSELMLEQCRSRHQAAVREGRLALIRAEFPGIPAEARFDRILAVNSLQFDGMNEPVLGALAESLIPGGRIVITFQPRGSGASAERAAAFGDRAAGLLSRAGFSDPRIETLPLEPVPAVAVLATRSGERRG